MNFVDIHHLVIVYLLIHYVFLTILLCQSILILVLSSLLSIRAIHLRTQEVEVDPWFLAILDDHFELISECQHLQGFNIKRSGLKQPLNVAMILQLFVHGIEIEP